MHKNIPWALSPRWQKHLGLQANINYTCPNLQQKGSHSRWGISAIHYAARHLHTCSWPLSFPCERWARKGAALTRGQVEAATDCKAARVICTCTALPSSFCSSSSLTETQNITTFGKRNFREIQKEPLGAFGRTGCKHCWAGWSVRSCGLCPEEMDEKVQASSWVKTQLSRIHLWICRTKAIDCKENSWSSLLKCTV